MINRLLLVIILASLTTLLNAQTANNFTLNVTGGITGYQPSTDFQSEELFIEGRPFNAGNGNVAEPINLPFARVALSYDVSERLRVSPFAQLITGKGTLNETDFFRFGVSDTNPVEKTFMRSSPNEVNVFTAGVSAEYLLVNGPSTDVRIGTGLAFMRSSHNYRSHLEVNFNETYDPISVVEEFNTSRKSALGIPLSVGVDQEITDRFSVGLRAALQFHPNLEDTFWTTGLNAGIKL